MKIDLLVAAEHRERARMLRALDRVPDRSGTDVVVPILLPVDGDARAALDMLRGR